MADPTCVVRNGYAAAVPTIDGVNVTPGDGFEIQLASTADVDSWSIACLTTDELGSAEDINAALTIDAALKTATGVSPVAGRAMRFQSQVNNGYDRNGVRQPSYTKTFGIYTLINGKRVHAALEQLESHHIFGWLGSVNALIRGGSGGGTIIDAFSVDDSSVNLLYVAPGGNTLRSYTLEGTITCHDETLASYAVWDISAFYITNQGYTPLHRVTTVPFTVRHNTDPGVINLDVGESAMQILGYGKAATPLRWRGSITVTENLF